MTVNTTALVMMDSCREIQILNLQGKLKMKFIA